MSASNTVLSNVETLIPPRAETFRFSPEVVVLSETTGERAEAIRALRTHIVAQHIDDGRRGLAICGASAGVGCTFVAANLAVALAQVGMNVLLIDGDMRTPSVENMIVPSEPVSGLRQALTEGAPFGNYIQDNVIPNLSVMYAGGPAHDAQELLAGTAFQNALDRCLRDFDVTLVDTPAANTCADARIISNAVGYSLIVARQDLSFVNDVSTLSAQLQEDKARVVGAVLNQG